MTAPQSNEGDEQVSQAKGPSTAPTAKPRKRWHERTSVTLCVAAVLAVVGLGFLHILVGVTNPYGLPFDIVPRESFGYRELVVDLRHIQSLPYTAAKSKYPLSLGALQRGGYLPDDFRFEARMLARQRESISQWQREFEESLGRPATSWQERLWGAAPPAGLNPGDARAYNQQGIRCARHGEYAQALAEFSRAIGRDPTLADAYYNRAMVQIAIGNVGPAASDLGKVTDIRPDFVEGHIQRGRLHVAMNEQDEALADFAKAIEIDANCAEAHFLRSLIHYTNGDYEKAREDIRKVQDLGLPVPAGLLHTLRGEIRSGRMRISDRRDE